MIWKKFLLLLPVLLLTACNATFTRLTPVEQPRNSVNLYSVETTFNSPQQSLRWDSIKAYVLVNGELYPMRPVPIVKNRWEGLVPVPASANSTSYRFKFDYLYNNFATAPQPGSSYSPQYLLKVTDQ